MGSPGAVRLLRRRGRVRREHPRLLSMIEETFTMFYVIKFYKLPLKVNLGPPLCINYRIDYGAATPQCISRLYPAVYIRILYYSLTFIAKWGTHLHDSHARSFTFIT
jgi:hypothetical protein